MLSEGLICGVVVWCVAGGGWALRHSSASPCLLGEAIPGPAGSAAPEPSSPFIGGFLSAAAMVNHWVTQQLASWEPRKSPCKRRSRRRLQHPPAGSLPSGWAYKRLQISSGESLAGIAADALSTFNRAALAPEGRMPCGILRGGQLWSSRCV